MILSEKIRPIGINTDISPMSVEAGNDGNRAIVNPVIDGLNRHYYTSENGASLRSENIKGTVQKSNSLPAGTNICIGTYEDQLNNKLIFWNYNSNGNHGVYAYSPESDAVATLIQVSGLNFQNDRRYLVTGAGSIGQLLYWSDGFNPQRVINMSRTYPYTGFDISHISLLKPQPYLRAAVGELTFSECPVYDRDYDSNIKTNLISGLNFQFSYRYKYLDNEYSTIAPISVLSYGDFDSDTFNTLASFGHYMFSAVTTSDGKYTLPNKIRLQIALPFTPQNFIKSVEILVSKNNLQTWSVFNTIQNPSGNIDIFFTASEAQTALAVADTSKLFESIPNYSKALVVHKNRVFISTDQEGFDVNDTPTISVSEVPFTSVNSIHLAGGYTFTSLSTITITVPGGNYQIGETIVFSDNQLPTPPGVYVYGRVTAINGGGSFDFFVFFQNGLFSSVSITNPWVRQLHSRNTGGDFEYADTTKTYWKTNSVHQFGIAVFDAQQRCMGIISKTTYNASPNQGGALAVGGLIAGSSGVYIGCSNDILLNLTLGGNFAATPKAAYYSVCVTKDQTYESYQQMVVRVLFYKFDQPVGYSPAAGEFAYDGKIFKSTPTTTGDFSKIYLMLPREVAVVPDNTFYVRPLGGWGKSIERVNSVISNFLVVGNFNMSNADIVALTANPYNYFAVIELFKPKTSNDGLFYEITDRYSIDGAGNMSTTTFKDVKGFNYRNINLCSSLAPYPNSSAFTFPTYSTYNNITGYLVNIESPTPITTQIDTSKNLQTDTTFYSRLLNLDYTKIADNHGKLIVEVQEKKAFTRTSVIRFSNSYVQDTNINGLSNFNSANQYSLPYERGDITKVVTVGNRLLVIHKFNSTVVFTNENVVTKADGSQDLIASSAVVAYDRALQDGGFGCYHAESIAQIEGQVFAYDIYKGVVWRYTEAGQFPISNYGRKEYFRTKSKTYLPNKDAVKIIGGVDPFNKEYIITFNDGTGASETLAFNYEKEKWTTRYSFIPEYYGKINNKLISFKNGALWVHNESSTYNNFYGVQYPSFLKLAVNPHPSWVKAFMGIDLAIEAISSDIDFKQIEVYTEEGQYSYIKSDEFEKHENVFYANILKDVNTPPATLGGALALREGDDIRSKYILLQVNDDQITKNSMQFINLAYTRSEYSQ